MSADVGSAQARRRHAADVVAELDEGYFLSQLVVCNGGNPLPTAAGGCTVDAKCLSLRAGVVYFFGKG